MTKKNLSTRLMQRLRKAVLTNDEQALDGLFKAIAEEAAPFVDTDDDMAAIHFMATRHTELAQRVTARRKMLGITTELPSAEVFGIVRQMVTERDQC